MKSVRTIKQELAVIRKALRRISEHPTATKTEKAEAITDVKLISHAAVKPFII